MSRAEIGLAMMPTSGVLGGAGLRMPVSCIVVAAIQGKRYANPADAKARPDAEG
jgi:hypothetical protein